MENTKKPMYQTVIKATLAIFLISAIVALLASTLTSSAKEVDTTLPQLTKTLEIKASELKEAKELEQATKQAYDEAVKVRELKQEEKKQAMDAINNYINSGVQSFQKPENLK